MCRADHLAHHLFDLVVEGGAVDETSLLGFARHERPVREGLAQLTARDAPSAADVGEKHVFVFVEQIEVIGARDVGRRRRACNASGAVLCAPMRTN